MEVNNKAISFFFNKFDFIIRFMYCKLNFIRKLLFWKLYSSDYEYLDKQFEQVKTILQENNFSIENKTVLELGPGNSFIIAYNYLMNNAEKVILVDKYPLNAYKIVATNIDEEVLTEKLVKDKKSKQKQFLVKEIDFIKKKYSTENPNFLKNNIIDTQKLQFIAKDLSEINNLSKIDIVFSTSVLEHIYDVEKTIKAMSEITTKDSILIHNIDLRDHYNFNRPFLFYKYSEKTWNKYLTKLGISYTNRLRYNDYIELFTKFGFKIITEKRNILPMKEKKIDMIFKNRTDLNIASIILILKKIK